jgi:hypothetical protein
MTLAAMRRWSRLIAAVLLLAAGRLPHLAVDDVACLPGTLQSFGQHDETQHALRAGSTDHDNHCAVCHWTRSLRSPRTDFAVAAAHVDPLSLLYGAASDRTLAPVFRSLPARAPPTQLL